jgi:hypothetical protein
MIKDTAIEIREIDGSIKLFLLTGLVNESFMIEGENGIPVLNPMDVINNGYDFEYPNKPNFFWVDRNNFEIMWENATGKRGKAFADVALLDDNTGEYDARLVAEFIKKKQSKITNSVIGSTHWFRTIMGNNLRIGEYLKTNNDISPSLLNDWGKQIYDSCKELLEWQEKNKTLTND